jgi:hypothetical protein
VLVILDVLDDALDFCVEVEVVLLLVEELLLFWVDEVLLTLLDVERLEELEGLEDVELAVF